MAYRKVAVAGATGNLGPSLVKELVDAGFEVTTLSRSGNTSGLPSGVKTLKVDYEDQAALTEALKGQDAFVSNLPNHNGQKPLIDAAIAAGVKRFIPSEFGSNVSGNSKAAALAPFKGGKAAIQEYLHSKGDAISWTLVVNGAFLDWALKVGFIINTKGNGPTRVFDGGNRKFSATNLDDVGKAVAGVLKHPEETKNRAVYVQSREVSQNDLLAAAKKVIPGFEPEIQHVDTKDLEKDAYANIEKGGEHIRAGMMSLVVLSIVGEGYGSNWSEKNDNELLGIKPLSDKAFEDLFKPYA